VLEHLGGKQERWQVVDRQIVDSRVIALDMGLAADLLTLVTCYPFDATAAGGPLRLVITLRPEIEPGTSPGV
jgi:sortase A